MSVAICMIKLISQPYPNGPIHYFGTNKTFIYVFAYALNVSLFL